MKDKQYILGLDISTANVGWSLLAVDDSTYHLGYVALENIKSVFKKAQKVKDAINELASEYNIASVCIEAPFTRFQKGRSSAKTISKLLTFNGMVSMHCFEIFDEEPNFVTVNDARKTLNIKINRKIDVDTKDQVLSIVRTHIPDYTWPTKILKSGPSKGKIRIIKQCYDMADAYVISRYWKSTL